MFELLPRWGWFVWGVLLGENATEKSQEYLSFLAIRRCAVFVTIWVLTDQVWNSLSDFGFLVYILLKFWGVGLSFICYFSLCITFGLHGEFFFFYLVTQSSVFGVLFSGFCLLVSLPASVFLFFIFLMVLWSRTVPCWHLELLDCLITLLGMNRSCACSKVVIIWSQSWLMSSDSGICSILSLT